MLWVLHGYKASRRFKDRSLTLGSRVSAVDTKVWESQFCSLWLAPLAGLRWDSGKVAPVRTRLAGLAVS